MPDITADEIEMLYLKWKRTPGEDGITKEILQFCGPIQQTDNWNNDQVIILYIKKSTD